MNTKDIPDYLTNSNPDKQEWIKRRVLASRWNLRRLIEEVKFVAEQYQMKIKYDGNQKELLELKSKLRNLLQECHDVAKQIKTFT